MNKSILRVALVAALGLTGIFGTPVAYAQVAATQQQADVNGIVGIESVVDGDGTAVRIMFRQPLQKLPDMFAVTQPARISIDLPGGTESLLPGKVKEFPAGDVKSATVVVSDTRTRVVLALRAAAQYQPTLDGRSLLIRTTSKVGANGELKRFAEGNNAQHAIQAFDFRRGPAGEGRVLVDLSDAEAGIDIRQQGNKLTVDFRGTKVPDALQRKMNVADFATAVQNVTLTAIAGAARMVIEPTGSWEYNAYQAEKRFVVEIKPKVVDPRLSVVADAPTYSGEKLSLNFQNIDVRNLLNVIADFTKLNIVTADTVQGNLTVRLQDVPWDQALDIILATRGLDKRKQGNVIWVAPAEEIAKREKDALEAKAQIGDLEPTRTESFLLNYAKATEVAALLNNQTQRLLSKRGSVVVDTRTNQLFVQDTATKLDEVRKMLQRLDIAVRQVQIEARIVEATDSFGQTLGARLGFFNANPVKLGNARASLGGFITPPGEVPTNAVTGAGGAGAAVITTVPQVNLPATPFGAGASPSAFALTLFNSAATKFLSMELSAAEADGRGKIVSSPRVVTGNQEKALIEQGTELPYQQASSSGATNVAFKKANLKLEVTPQITPDGNVVMELDINKDAPGAQTSAGYAIDTKHITTKVLVENGGTIVIGGIYTQDERVDVEKVPVLGDLPAVGNLFRTKTARNNRTELLVFLTPRILSDAITGAK